MTGAELIAAERQRQIDEEGYSPEHDRVHGGTRLHRAGAAYQEGNAFWWPFEMSSWKPKDPLSNLIRAGAFFQAAADVEEEGHWRHRAIQERDRCARGIDAIRATADRVWGGR